MKIYKIEKEEPWHKCTIESLNAHYKNKFSDILELDAIKRRLENVMEKYSPERGEVRILAETIFFIDNKIEEFTGKRPE